jgi:acyl carrier protein
MAAVSSICAKGEKALFCWRELEEKEALSKSGSDWARNLTIAFAGPSGNVGGDLVLADYGLDSLGFPVLVARLEDTLGADDQFAATEDAIFPETLGDIVKVYEHGGR